MGRRWGTGRVHSADGWRAVLEPVTARYREALYEKVYCARGQAENPGFRRGRL
jgi:hypothetical protein